MTELFCDKSDNASAHILRTIIVFYVATSHTWNHLVHLVTILMTFEFDMTCFQHLFLACDFLLFSIFSVYDLTLTHGSVSSSASSAMTISHVTAHWCFLTCERLLCRSWLLLDTSTKSFPKKLDISVHRWNFLLFLTEVAIKLTFFSLNNSFSILYRRL